MSVLINSPLPSRIEAFLEERRKTGADRFDEVWEGVLHVAPAPTGAHGDVLLQVMEKLGPLARSAGLVPCAGGFNLGNVDDYRIPDGGIRRGGSDATFFDSAVLVVEVVSPGDETYAKLPFYAKHAVEEVVIVDPRTRSVSWLRLDGPDYRVVDESSVVPLRTNELARGIDWPELAG